MEYMPLIIIDKILSFDEYGKINLIVALRLENDYIQKYSKMLSQGYSFCWERRLLKLIKGFRLYKLDQDIINILPKIIWEDDISERKILKESFIIKNAHNLNLAKVKYYRKNQKFTPKFHAALPSFRNLDKCNQCFERDAVDTVRRWKQGKNQRMCSVCKQNLCDRCDIVFDDDEIPFEYDEKGCCPGCDGCTQYDRWDVDDFGIS